MTSATVIIASLAAVALAGWWWTAWTAERARDKFLGLIEERDADTIRLLDDLDQVTAARNASQNSFVTLNRLHNALLKEAKAADDALADARARVAYLESAIGLVWGDVADFDAKAKEALR